MQIHLFSSSVLKVLIFHKTYIVLLQFIRDGIVIVQVSVFILIYIHICVHICDLFNPFLLWNP